MTTCHSGKGFSGHTTFRVNTGKPQAHREGLYEAIGRLLEFLEQKHNLRARIQYQEACLLTQMKTTQ